MKIRKKWLGALAVVGAIGFGLTVPTLLMCQKLQPNFDQRLSPPVETSAEPESDTGDNASWQERVVQRWNKAKQTTREWATTTAEKTDDWATRTSHQMSDWLEDDAPWAGEQTWLTKRLIQVRRYCTR